MRDRNFMAVRHSQSVDTPKCIADNKGLRPIQEMLSFIRSTEPRCYAIKRTNESPE